MKPPSKKPTVVVSGERLSQSRSNSQDTNAPATNAQLVGLHQDDEPKVVRPDPEEIAARERRRKKRAAQAEARFEEQTQAHFAEFESLFQKALDQARVSAAKRNNRLPPWRIARSQEGQEAMIEQSFTSRIVTVILKQPTKWSWDDCDRWLGMLGISPEVRGDTLTRLHKRKFETLVVYRTDD